MRTVLILIFILAVRQVAYCQFEYMILSESKNRSTSNTLQVFNADSLYDGLEFLVLKCKDSNLLNNELYHSFSCLYSPFTFCSTRGLDDEWSGDERIYHKDSIDNIFWIGNWYHLKVRGHKIDTLGKFIKSSNNVIHTIADKNIGTSSFFYRNKKLFSSIQYYKNGKIDLYSKYADNGKANFEMYFYKSGKIEAILDFSNELYSAYNKRGDKIIKEYLVLDNLTGNPKILTTLD